MSIKKYSIALISLMLIACGDDEKSGVSVPEENLKMVSSVGDLEDCSKDIDGDSVFVKDKMMDYVCLDGNWKPLEEDEVKSSSSKESKKSSSSKEEKKDERKSSSSSYDKKESGSSSSSKKVGSSSSLTVKEITISGVVQKGPFYKGSKVVLRVLDEKTLLPSKKTFSAEVLNDKGEYSISGIPSGLKYATLEATGYYRNEVTGKKTHGVITLNAIVDLADREKVNINLITHLEYKRVLYLVGSGWDFKTAKKQAKADVVKAFYLEGSEKCNSEDLHIFNENCVTYENESYLDVTLMPISILMLHNLPESDNVQLMTNLGIDIEKDGKWDDESTKAKIADWVADQDLLDSFETIRGNIKNWNMGTFYDFGYSLREFWHSAYGLTSSLCNEGDVVSVNNKYSAKQNLVCKNEKWVEASAVETALGGCTGIREGESGKNIGKVNGIWYICRDQKWEETDIYTVDTYRWSSGTDGKIHEGDSSGLFYKYDEMQDKWLLANEKDTTLDLKCKDRDSSINGCTMKLTDEVCWGRRDGDDFGNYYVCRNMEWQLVQDIDTYGKVCNDANIGQIMEKTEIRDNRYYCSSKGWVSLTDDWSWDVPKELRFNPNIEYEFMEDPRDGQKYRVITISNGSKTQIWMAENLNYYNDASLSLKDNSWCFDEKPENCLVGGRLYSWAAAIDSANLYEAGLDCGYGKECSLPAVVQGVCPTGWHLPSRNEWAMLYAIAGGEMTIVANRALKARSGWYSEALLQGNGTDDFGFSALPVGYMSDSGYGSISFRSGEAWFWSSTENNQDYTYFARLEPYENVFPALQPYGGKNEGFSVRCIKDNE